MASVERRGKRWYARWRDPAGKQCSKSFDRKVDAEAHLRGIERDLDQGSYVDPSLGRQTLQTFWNRWHPLAKARLRPSTMELYDLYWRRTVGPEFADRPLASITRLDVQNFMGALIAQGLSIYVTETSIRLLRTLLNAAVEDGILARSPTDRLKLPKRPPVDPEYYSADDLHAIADAVPERWRAFILLAGYGGPRFGELAGLRVDRVDFAQRQVRIDHAIVEVRGQLYPGPTKNRQVRTVSLPSFVMDALAEHIERWPPEQDGLVFTDEGGGPVKRSNFYKRVWWPGLRISAVKPLKFHALRHTAAALAIASGAHPKAIQMRLGHHSAAFTLDTYGGLFEGMDRDLADKLEKYGPPSAPTPEDSQSEHDANDNVIDFRKRRRNRGSSD